MKLHTPESAVLSAVIFNALVIVALIPLALRGVKLAAQRRPRPSCGATSGSTAIGGIIVPFIGIKLIDLILTALHWY